MLVVNVLAGLQVATSWYIVRPVIRLVGNIYKMLYMEEATELNRP